ncbi:MAG TPA: polyprenol monophosphomannose synthase [Victivallales bacterium]|nr:polyprenol monophosphomannose synthase [Victivallales bacterium]
MLRELSIIIPTYNEAENILTIISRLIARLDDICDYEIIVSDDDSPDGTWRLVQDLSEKNPRVKLLRRIGRKKGLSQSVVDGFHQSDGKILLVMDGDGQHDESCLPGIIELSKENDMVIGSRFAENSIIEDKWPAYRLLASKVAIFTASLLLGVRISDPMSGFFTVSKEAFNTVSPHIKAEGFKIMLEILCILKRKKPSCKIAETGIKFRKREKGSSKLGLGVTLNLIKMILRLKISRLHTS